MTAQPDPLLEALIVKLGDKVSPKYPLTFLGEDGYALQQKLLNLFGYPTVRWAFTYALEEQIVPVSSPMGLMRTLCVRRISHEEARGGAPGGVHPGDPGSDRDPGE